MTFTAIPASTLQAYRQTDYRVYAPHPFTLRIGQFSQALLQLHQQYGVSSSAFVTACNPFSRLLTSEQNAERQLKLVEAVEQRGWPYLSGSGQHFSGPWPAEASLLVLGIVRDEAAGIGRDFDQNAVVFCEGDCVPQLLLLR